MAVHTVTAKVVTKSDSTKTIKMVTKSSTPIKSIVQLPGPSGYYSARNVGQKIEEYHPVENDDEEELVEAMALQNEAIMMKEKESRSSWIWKN